MSDMLKSFDFDWSVIETPEPGGNDALWDAPFQKFIIITISRGDGRGIEVDEIMMRLKNLWGQKLDAYRKAKYRLPQRDDWWHIQFHKSFLQVKRQGLVEHVLETNNKGWAAYDLIQSGEWEPPAYIPKEKKMVLHLADGTPYFDAYGNVACEYEDESII